MNRMAMGGVIGGVVCVLAASAGAGEIWGIKSMGSALPSQAPANLFRFNHDASGFTDFGPISIVGGGNVDADALAASSTLGLYAFWLTPNGSQLMHLGSGSPVGTTVGTFMPTRSMRAATFDAADRLWAIDASTSEIMQINPLTGSIIGMPALLHTAVAALLVEGEGSDIAVTMGGEMIFVNGNRIYSLDPFSGAATLLGQDPTANPVNFLVGAAFSPDAPADRLFAFEVNGTDDLITYDMNVNYNPSPLIPHILPGFNAGRGDLASVIPGPGLIGVLGAAGLVGLVRRRR
ncbi:MAG: hypothetical protein HUU18_09040 [Phycisphaerales bacterium]|nr:hypothetical protein [Phycisphaerales bacterium]